MHKLSAYFPHHSQDGIFAQLDEADSDVANSLAYCQTLEYWRIAQGNPNISAILTTQALAREPSSKPVAWAENPRAAFFRTYVALKETEFAIPKMAFGVGANCRIHPTAVISPRSFIGKDVEIAAHAVIEDFSHIGDGAYIGPNAVIGAEGLLTIWQEDGTPLVVKHAGGVEIGKGVVVLAGAIVAKSLFRSFTRIGDDSQIGIMTNIGHGVRIAERCVVSSNCVIAGRTRLGPKVWIGASSSVAQGLKIGAGAQIKMGSVVVASVPEQAVMSGNFAVSHIANMKNYYQVKAL